jgi:hypothetical protein
MFLASIAPETPLATAVWLEMRGEIRLKGWTAFSGTELLAPHEGFLWTVRAGAISGYDRYLAGEGEMRWRLLGLVPVMRASGPDVSRSAAGRAAAEAAWVPTSLLPRFGVGWSAVDDRHIVAELRLDGHEVELQLRLDEQAHIAACSFQRWGDPDGTGTFGLHPFGMEATAHRTFEGLTIPSAGHAGWHHGTERWEDGVFFRYEITDLRPLT